jgi:PIN domain nuclease of toxin-antitoxin system
MPDPSRPLLLDTHIWIWIMEAVAGEIAPSVIDRIRQASKEGTVLISAISIWEVALLQVKGRLRLSRDLDEWVRTGLSAPGVRLAELSPEILVESTRLPGAVHGDPADRMLIATARRLGATLVTRDAAILSYARQGYLSVLDATP